MRKLLYTVLIFSLIATSLIGCKSNTVESIEDSLVGVWRTSVDNNLEAEIEFQKSGDEYIGEYNLYDYGNGEWGTNKFKLKSIDNFTLTLLLSTGEIEQMSFAASQDTLYLSGIAFVNSEKNVATARTDTYIKEGVITPIICDVFLGMTEVEFDRSDFKNNCSDSFSGFNLPKDFYHWYPSDYSGLNWGNVNYFDGHLTNLSLYFAYNAKLSSAKTILTNIIEEYSLQFGDYSKLDGIYVWQSGNLEVTLEALEYDVGLSYYHVKYSLK